MSTRISAAALLDINIAMIGYLTTLVLVILLGSVLWGVRRYRRHKLHSGESDQFSADLSEAVWPSADHPELNAKFASALRGTKPKDMAAAIAAELNRSPQ